MIGKKISPVLVELENTIWNFEANNQMPPEYTDEGFKAICKIFMSALMDKQWVLQNHETIDMEDRCKMAEKCGEDLRNLIKVYTDLDTHEFYK